MSPSRNNMEPTGNLDVLTTRVALAPRELTLTFHLKMPGTI